VVLAVEVVASDKDFDDDDDDDERCMFFDDKLTEQYYFSNYSLIFDLP